MADQGLDGSIQPFNADEKFTDYDESRTKVVRIAPAKTDAENAAKIRGEITFELEKMCKMIDSAKASGFDVAFQLAKDGLGRQFINSLLISKPF